MSLGTMDELRAELAGLIEREIPEGRQQMEASFNNLERVAAFCEANYHQAENKAGALVETQRYTVQSLASVAYQINTLASNFLAMLDLQTDSILDMEAQVENIAMIVDSHKEKVGRREIGALTANKIPIRPHKIVAPPVAEKPQRYIRRSIDFSLLDDLGHGVKVQTTAPLGTLSRGGGGGGGGGFDGRVREGLGRTASNVSGGSSGSGASAPQWMDPRYHHQPPPSSLAGGRGSLSKGSGYRMGAAAPASTPQAPPPASVYAPSNLSTHSGASTMTGNSAYASAVPPPPPLGPLAIGGAAERRSSEEFPPPPSPGYMDGYGGGERHSPPLPPPPLLEESGGAEYGSYVAGGGAPLPSWVPNQYLEKVVAIYDYQAEKPDELSFSENAEIYVLKKNEDGWFEGVLNGSTGLFPGNYVEACM